MNTQLAVQKLLTRKLSELQAKNPAFSLRAFARRAGLSPATASLILNGKRKISHKLALKICQALMLDPRERAEILKQFPTQTKTASETLRTDSVDTSFIKLTSDQFRVIADWYYFGILSLVKTESFKNDPKWIARRLGIKVTEARTAIERLKRLEILAEDETGKLYRTGARYHTSDDVKDVSVRRSHFQSLELAKRSLENDPVEKRDFSSMTMAIHPERMAEAKTLIRKFSQELDALLESAPDTNPTAQPKDVYRLCVQLFPLTQNTNDQEDNKS